MRPPTERDKTMITIDKDKPMPNGFGVRGKYPFAELDVGHSFFVPGKTTSGISSSVANARTRMPGRKFVTNTVTENGVTGVRVWRVQ
jgi:hypothetical protein